MRFTQDEIPSGGQASVSSCYGAKGLMGPPGLGDAGVGTQPEGRDHTEHAGYSDKASGARTVLQARSRTKLNQATPEKKKNKA